MATIIPDLNQRTLARMTAGEKRVARRLERFLEDDYCCWYDIPVGNKRRYPDFIVLHPGRGLLFLEVKDWKAETIKRIDKTTVELLTDSGLKTTAHPLEQARQCTYPVIKLLERDPLLCQSAKQYQGKLALPYGWGVVFTNITRAQMRQAIPDAERELLMPDHLTLYKDEMLESSDPEVFQEQLWAMFNYNFGDKLSLAQIDRIRWHLFPEVRITTSQDDLFAAPNEEADTAANDSSELQGDSASSSGTDTDNAIDKTLPSIVKIMDIQQEQLARSLGEGHRVIHGVAGSGKTLILGYRCQLLAQTSSKPILVLCFNVTLAAKLRDFIRVKGIDQQVQVYHFHDWCAAQLKTYNVDLLDLDKERWECQVDTVIDAVEKGAIPRAQYGALLIDEGHDFEADWLKLVTQMIDLETDSLLLLYDDAQSIYKKRAGLGFSLSSVGIKAKGRTTILKLNYRNTREILDFSYRFAKHHLNPESADDDHIPLVEPEGVGNTGPQPVVKQFDSLRNEVAYAIHCIDTWHQRGVCLGDIAVLYANKGQGKLLADGLTAKGLAHLWMSTKVYKQAYKPSDKSVSVLTMHSSKGLEFPRVIILGLGSLDCEEEKNARLLYVAMTRAQQCLLLSTSKDNAFSQQLLEISKEVA